MLNCVVKIQEHTKQHERYKYYRAFASEQYIVLCRSTNSKLNDYNENEAFSVMDINFNDFVFINRYRSFDEIRYGEFKYYHEIGITDSDGKERIELLSNNDKGNGSSYGFKLKVFEKD